MNIVLIGMRGSGKTTVGKILAKNLKRDFIEMDDLIVEKAGMTIPNIVSKKGWDYFRSFESEIARNISKRENAVISCGGGIVIKSKNVKNIRKNGKVFWLRGNVNILLKRIGNDKNRPFLTNAKTRKEDMEIIFNERKNLYKKASDEVIDIKSKSVKEIAKIIEEKIKKYND